MSVKLINPDTLPKEPSFHHVALAAGSRLVFTAGQTTGRNPDGTPIGGSDLGAQAEQAYLNVAKALAAAGATFDDVVKLNIYVAKWSEDKLEALVGGIMRAGEKLGVDVIKPNTLAGVASLWKADLLVELEAVAVLP